MISGFQGDPRLKWSGGDGGDIVKNAGDYERNPGIENMINILLGTNRKVWSNVFRANKIPGFAIVRDDIITIDTLSINERNAERALSPLVTLNIAETVTVTASNPTADNIDLFIVVAEKRGKESTYTRTWSAEFDNIPTTPKEVPVDRDIYSTTSASDLPIYNTTNASDPAIYDAT